MPALQANALYMERYPLVSALSRPVIVKHLAGVALEPGAGWVAHGCTGKGNDQVRFEAGTRRDGAGGEVHRSGPRLRHDPRQGNRVRGRKSMPINVTKRSPYSIDQNVWGRSCRDRAPGGHLERAARTFTATPRTRPRAARAGDPHQLRQRHPGRAGRHATVAAARRLRAEQARRRARHRPDRHGRGPAGRHQEPRDLRGTRRDDPDRCHSELESVCVERDLASYKRSASSSAGPSWSTTGSGSRR